MMRWFLFIIFFFFKNTLHKNRDIFVLSYEAPFFGIYYIINQRFKHCTIFVQNGTNCTFLYKMVFCTQNEIPYRKSTRFVRT